MEIKCDNELFKTAMGVYMIENKTSEKIYIGSTTMYFKKRYNHHHTELLKGRHKNRHLQNAFNKYGDDDFTFDILEVCEKDKCLEREQYFLNEYLEADEYLKGNINYFQTHGYNINPCATGTPNLSKEVCKKRGETLSKSNDERRKYRLKLDKGEITMDEIPYEYRKTIINWNKDAWNKGTKCKDTSHLKVKKTITDKVLKARKVNSEKRRNNAPRIKVYDIEHNFLKEFRSSKDLEEWSKTDKNDLPVVLTGRAKTNVLLSPHINKHCKDGIIYKGLFFEYVPG